jgi:hypothetical protein
MERNPDDNTPCVDCGDPNATMHNSRESLRLSPGRVNRFPGYLCVECWIKANPSLFKHGYRFKPRAINVGSPPWAMTALGLIVAVLIFFLFMR